MRRAIAVGLMGAVAASCNLDTSGQVSGAPPSVGDDSGTAAETGLGTSGEGSTSSAPTSSADGTTGSAADDTTGSDPKIDLGGADGHPVVSISDPNTYDFGPQDIHGPGEHTFEVTNSGDADATALVVSLTEGAFSLTSTDCEAVLPAGTSCDVVVTFDPDLFGSYKATLQVSFDDAGMADMTARPMEGLGVGITANLLANPGCEEGNTSAIPPESWLVGQGNDWSCSQEVTAHTDSFSMHAGGGNLNWHILYQPFSANTLTTGGDLAGVQFHYRGFHRAWEYNNDPTRLSVRFLDGDGMVVETYYSDSYVATAWHESVGTAGAPAGSQTVLFRLMCEHDIGTECSGYFDDLELQAEWSG